MTNNMNFYFSTAFTTPWSRLKVYSFSFQHYFPYSVLWQKIFYKRKKENTHFNSLLCSLRDYQKKKIFFGIFFLRKHSFFDKILTYYSNFISVRNFINVRNFSGVLHTLLPKVIGLRSDIVHTLHRW